MSTITSAVTEEKPLILRTNLLDIANQDDRDAAKSTPAFYAAMAAVVGFVAPIAITLETSAQTVPLAFAAMAITGLAGFFVGNFKAMKELAMVTAKKRTYNTTQQETEMVASIRKYTKFPHGQYLKLSTNPVVLHPDTWQFPNRYTQSEGWRSTHTKESGIVFTLTGAYLQETISKNANNVWDDALDAVTRAHGLPCL